IKKAIRIWPHRMEGEGHFVALLQKSKDAKEAAPPIEYVKAAKLSGEAKEFLGRLRLPLDVQRIIARDERLYYLPEGLPELGGLRILRSGLLLGEMKKNRFEPSQALACALKAEEYENCYNLPATEEDVIRYLKCETITAKTPVADGFVLVCADGYPLGWGKASGGVIKNKYLAGWRMM
ncbi:MAG: RsmF rRNA methyltransferase first C-terminal domain-containing protein, partial [Lachnospiraceae bacterium]